MKLKKVAALCCQEGAVRLFDQTDASGEVVRQWLGDGRAAYPIDGMPYMETDNICTMFDIPEKKQEKMTFRHVAATEDINWRDDDPVSGSFKTRRCVCAMRGGSCCPCAHRTGSCSSKKSI